MNISLIGLPSAGKSSIVNSLIGKRIAQSGVCRTTVKETLYQNLVSDDNIDFNIYDLPGIADIEDKEHKFDNLIKDCITKSNLVIWISDIKNAFLTNHEETEFNKIQEYITKIKLTEGIPIQLIIMLSKVDQTIESLEEDTHNKVTKQFPNIDILCYNAFGKSLYGPTSSINLKEFVRKYNPTDNNILFNLKKYFDLLPDVTNDALYEHCIKYQLKQFLKKPLCDTLLLNNDKPILNNLPNGITLFCLTYYTLAEKCYSTNCPTCNNHKYIFKCKDHATY